MAANTTLTLNILKQSQTNQPTMILVQAGGDHVAATLRLLLNMQSALVMRPIQKVGAVTFQELSDCTTKYLDKNYPSKEKEELFIDFADPIILDLAKLFGVKPRTP